MIDGAAEKGRLHRVFRGVYAVGHRAFDRRGLMLAAVFACGEGAVVSHGSAAELLGLWSARPVLVHVIAPTQGGRRIEGIRWHRVSRPDPLETTFVEGTIPCTTVARTLVDMAGSLGRKSLRRMVEQAAVLRLLDVAEIDRILARGRRRGAPLLREALVDWHDGGLPRLRSVFEARLLSILKRAGLPKPQSNVRLKIDGNVLEVDFLWPEQRVVVEADGEETHGTSAAFQRDRWRDQLLSVAGYRAIHVTWHQLESERQALVDRIARTLGAT